MKNGLKLAGIALLSLGLFTASAPARAAEGGQKAGKQWKQNHPRRAQVNKRLNRQNRRISQGVKSGKLSKQQAQQLRSNDKSIRQQERQDAAANGGHITKSEQKQLNQEENSNSKAIYDEKHPGSTSGGSQGGTSSPAPAPAAAGSSTGQ